MHRFRSDPDVFILGFRGIEIYWPVRLLTLNKPLIFDEFVETYDWIVNEHKKINPGSFTAKLLKKYVRSVLRSAQSILTDTDASSRFSSNLHSIALDKYISIPVGADENIFKSKDFVKADKDLRLLFYGSMLPLHGVDFLLEALEKINEGVVLEIIGGDERFQKKMESIKLNPAIEYSKWVDFEKLPEHIARADLCIAGPFGGTGQANRLITGKTYQFIAMGKPVLIGSNAESGKFENRNNCLIVEQKSSDGIAEAIRWAVDNKAKLADIGNNAKELYQNCFSQKHISQLVTKAVRQNALRSE